MHSVFDNIEQIVERGDTFKMTVTGYSMLPLLGNGHDHIVVRRTEDDEDIMGRIAMFRMPDRRIIVHRVVAIKDGLVTLHGDGNLYQREQVRREAIVGVVESVVRQSGKVVSCTTRLWRIRERIWLCQPLIIRRGALGIMRRWLNYKRR